MSLYDNAQVNVHMYAEAHNKLIVMRKRLQKAVLSDIKDKILLVTGGEHKGRYARVGKDTHVGFNARRTSVCAYVYLCHVKNIHKVMGESHCIGQQTPTFGIPLEFLTVVGDYNNDLPWQWKHEDDDE